MIEIGFCNKEKLQSLKNDLMKLEKTAFHPDIQEDWESKSELIKNSASCFLAWDVNRVIGEAYAVKDLSDEDGDSADEKHLQEIDRKMKVENGVYLCSLAVLPGYEGRGIARQLMEEVFDDLREQGYSVVYSHAKEGASSHLHEVFGGELIGKRENWYDTGKTHFLYRIVL